MALSTLWRSRPPEPESTSEVSTMTEMELKEFLSDYDIVEISDEPGHQYAIVTPRSVDPDLRELGSTSPSPWVSFNRREYNPKLLGIKGLEQYDKMRKGDGSVRGTLRMFKTPVLAAKWYMEPGGKKLKDKKAAEFAWKNLTEYMSISWTQVLTEALLMCDFGFYMFEKVYETRIIDGQTRTVWKKLAPRHPMDVAGWVWDDNGGPVGCWFTSTPEEAKSWRDEYMAGMDSTQTGNMPGQSNEPVGTVSGIPNLLNTNEFPEAIFIPIEKLLVFTFDKEAGNIEGVSVLRSAYKHWYFKEQLYKIDAIQKERHGIGIPVIKLPMGFKDEDKKAAEDLGRNIRTNERAHIVLPPGWDVAMLKLEGNPVDALKSIEHHDEQIEKNIVAYFLHAKAGSQSDTLVDIYLKSVRFLADIVAETFTMYCIPEIVQYNFPGAATPKLKYRHIGEAVDWRTMSFAIRNLIGAGVIRPDDPMEENMRDEMGLPPADPDSAREVATPQAGPKLPRVGPPRQTPVGGQRNTQGLPRSDAGRDNSGGK